MADGDNDPHDDRVSTVPLPSDEADGADRVIAQQNQNPESVLGGGEWPSPGTPPTGPSPGDTPSLSGARPDLRRDADEVDKDTDENEDEDEDGEFPPMREVLEADPVAGGSQSVPGDEAGGGDERWGGSRLA